MTTLQLPLSNAQIELLNLFAQPLPDESIADLKRLLLQFKFDQLEKLANDEWVDKNMNQDIINERLYGQHRTPYNSQNRFLSQERPDA